MGTLAFLVAVAPPIPEDLSKAGAPLLTTADAQPFRYREDSEAFALDFDPREVRVDLFEGWDREQAAYADRGALGFVSGPMYERHADGGREITVPLGDLKFGEQVWRGRNRTAARQRAFVGIRRDGGVEFGYGELTPERARRFDSFIGGLHSVYNDLESPPAAYKGAYSISMGQQIRYFLPRIRMVIGPRRDGRIEVLMSRDGLTLEQTRALARQRGLRAAYLPDHASKSRLIIPGQKGFSQSDANWISGGATSFVHVPYLLRLSRRPQPLQGALLAGLGAASAAAAEQRCSHPLQCGQSLAGQVLDRALAGLNRVMEQGVEPIARLIWAPRNPADPKQAGDKAPLREPPISADPLALRQRQADEGNAQAKPQPALGELDLPRDLPPPLLLPKGMELPADPATLSATEAPLPPPPLPATPEPPTATQIHATQIHATQVHATEIHATEMAAKATPVVRGAPVAPALPPPLP